VRRILLWSAIVVVAISSAALAQEGSPGNAAAVVAKPSDLKWGDAPPVFEKGASMAVVSGDPSKEGLYVVRLKMPAGYKINAHYHPTDEHVTVISGTFLIGMGDKLDKSKMQELPAGGYTLLPAQMHHYAMAKNACVVQVHGMGPFSLTYVDPTDDPTKRVPK